MEISALCREDDQNMKSANLVNQKRVGFKVNFELKYLPYCLIVCNCLPSIIWLFNRSSTFKRVYIFCDITCESYSNLEQKEMLIELAKVNNVNCDIVGRISANVLMLEHDVCKIGIGCVDFLWNWWKDRKSSTFQRSIIICKYNRLRSNQFSCFKVRWTRFAHQRLGGVTNSTWMIGILAESASTDLFQAISNIGLKRNLMSIIKDGELGKIVDPPLSGGLNTYWKINQPNEVFVVPSYRSRTGWVARSLTFEEKALCLDVNEVIIKKLEKASCHPRIRKNVELGTIVPGKINQIALQWIFTMWGKPVEVKQVDKIFNNSEIDESTSDSLSLIKPHPVMSTTDASYLKFEQRYLTSYGEKAAKDDDEKVPIELWDRYILRFHFGWLDYSPRVAKALEVIRNSFAFRRFIKQLKNSFCKYLGKTYGLNWVTQYYLGKNFKTTLKRKRSQIITSGSSDLLEDIIVGRDAISRAARSNWWEWSAGSTCYFWRWPVPIRKHIRDGFPVHVESKLPSYRQRQIFHLTDVGMTQLQVKVSKVIKRGYLEDGYVASLINYFAVPKGDSDIRVVYDGTKCGLNQSVWAPNFYLPSVDSLLLSSSTNTWFSDMDLGEMFLNFHLDKKVRSFAGVDVTKILNDPVKAKTWKRWNRTLMGFKSSPYIACKLCGWSVDIARGNRDDSKNPFKWDSIRLNLPGSESYDPTIPWICKLDGRDEASEVKVYVDDFRPVGSSEMRCRAAGKQLSKIIQYLGEQDAARKFRPPSQEPGPWCGSFVSVKNGSLWAYVSQKKWEKGKSYVYGWLNQVSTSIERGEDVYLEHKPLEQGRGFLVYLSRTYTSIVPYLKGVHLTLDSWRSGRDHDGWKMRANARRASADDVFHDEDMGNCSQNHIAMKQNQVDVAKAPKFVKGVPRLYNDLQALSSFFEEDIPPHRFVRGRSIYLVRYGFGDASKAGFGSTLETNNGISFRYGTWGTDGESKSSNYRELENLAQALEEEASQGNINGAEVFLFTDNSTAEGAYYKGTSSSKELFYIILRLRKLEFKSRFKIHFIHVAGSRMIAQGTDGLSRGDLSEGVMKGTSMLSFIPLHLTAFDRSSTLKDWMFNWISPSLKKSENIEFLKEEGWFWRGQDIHGGSLNDDGIWIPKFKKGLFIWSPAPAAGQFAVEQMRDARNKRTDSLHIFILPRLFTSIWRRQLYRVSDLLIELPFIDTIWEKEEQHEPLTLAFIFPFLSFSPWQLRRSTAFLEMDRLLPKMWKENPVATGYVLCEFLSQTRNLECMQQSLVRKMLCSSRNFKFFHSQT